MTNEEAARLERYRAVVKKIKTPDEMRRFMDDPASDPELARQIADAANFLLRLMAPEGSNSNPPENGPEVHQYDGSMHPAACGPRCRSQHTDDHSRCEQSDGWDDACRCGHVRASHQMHVGRCTICECAQFDGCQGSAKPDQSDGSDGDG